MDASGSAADLANIDDLLSAMLARMRQHPQGMAIIEPGGRWQAITGRPARSITHGVLGERIAASVAHLERLGLGAGEAVLYAVRPGVDSMVLLSALLLAGPLVVGLDTGLGAGLLAERLKPLGPRWVVAESIVYAATAPGPLRAWLRRRGMELPNIHLLGATLLRVGPWLPGVPRSIPCNGWWRAAAPAVVRRTQRPDRATLAIFTSGTTAAPKTVLHTSASLGAACATIGARMALAPADVVYSDQTHQMLAALLAGATCVVPAAKRDQRDALRFIKDVARYRVTHIYAIPFELLAVVAHLERSGGQLPAHVRAIILGSAPVRPAFLTRLRAVCAPATDVWCAYGMSEMFPITLVESREKLAFDGEGDLVGPPVAGAHVEVAEDGELWVSGPNLFAGYAGQPPLTRLATGDLARQDADGRVVLLGRKKDMIIRGRHNIYPALYEDTIARIPGVQNCALVGLATPDQADERLVLAVEPQAGVDAAELRRRVERALADGSCPIDAMARPDRVVVCTLPRTGRSHKIDRRRLAEQVAAELTRHGH